MCPFSKEVSKHAFSTTNLLNFTFFVGTAFSNNPVIKRLKNNIYQMGKKDIPMNLKGHKVYLSVNFGLLTSNNSSRDTGGETTSVSFSNQGLLLYSHYLIFVP